MMLLSVCIAPSVLAQNKVILETVHIFEKQPARILPDTEKVAGITYCEWTDTKVTVSSQADDYLAFKIEYCPGDNPVSFETEVHEGLRVFANYDEDRLHVFTLWRTGNESPENFLESLLPVGADGERWCKPVQSPTGVWKMKAFKNPPRDTLYPILSHEDHCGGYGESQGGAWVYGGKDGIVLAYSELMASLRFFDVPSIIYHTGN